MERCPVPGALDFVGDVPEVNAPLCTGCGVCQHVCPAPHNAIPMPPNAERPTSRALDLARPEPSAVELPELREADLDEQGLRALFRNLAAATRIEDIRRKAGAERRAETASCSPDAALEQLLEGRVRGVQVRYRYEGESWCDTILATTSGSRVVRMATPTRPTGLA